MGEIFAIFMLLAVVAIVMARLPKVEEVNHSDGFRKRRVMNWLPLGLTYAFLYMGRYNLKISKFAFEEMQDPTGGSLMGNDDFGFIFMVGVWVYGSAFLINGPLTDKYGGRLAILIGAAGSAIANLLMGLGAYQLLYDGPLQDIIASNFVLVFSILYGINMYFQSFGAVAMVKVNAPWFHIRERGVFGAIFGILISLGIYFAFDWGYYIVNNLGLIWVFLIPTIMLGIFWVFDFFLVQNSPADAGLEDFDTADASSGDDGPQLPAIDVFKKMLSNPIIITIALVEFCSGFIRQAPMQWYRTFAKQTDGVLNLKGDFIYDHWGMFLCIAGISGGVIAGVISDRVFQSRRGPVATLLYFGVTVGSVFLLLVYKLPAQMITFSGINLAGLILLIGGLLAFFLGKNSLNKAVQTIGVVLGAIGLLIMLELINQDLGTFKISPAGIMAILISMCVIGVHGMLSGTASMDFGGKKNVGIAVGIIDGFVYLGTGVMSLIYGYLLPNEKFDSDGNFTGPVTEPENWSAWPISMIIVGIIGCLLASRLWNAKPKAAKKAA
jgi:MFS transporter, OPA family, glycerol-3-phosphate transporter